METKFNILDEVSYFNTAEGCFATGSVRKIQIIPKAMHKDEEGKDVLDDVIVLYELESGIVLVESEVFATEEICKQYYTELLSML